MERNGDITIDEEFQELCPPLTPEEFSLLETSIDSDGCRDPLTLWKGRGLLLDGHNRYRICTDLEKKYSVRQLDLPDRQGCIEWIIANQLGRRNCSEEQKAYLRGKRYKHEKKKDGAPKGNKNAAKQPCQNDKVVLTSERLAEEYHVSPATIIRDEHFADAVDAIGVVAPAVKTEILTGKSDLTRKQIQEVAALPKSERKAALKEVAEEKPTPKDAGVKTDCGVFAERLDKLISQLDSMAAQRMGHNAKSQALKDHLEAARPLIKAMQRSWRNH